MRKAVEAAEVRGRAAEAVRGDAERDRLVATLDKAEAVSAAAAAAAREELHALAQDLSDAHRAAAASKAKEQRAEQLLAELTQVGGDGALNPYRSPQPHGYR